MEVLSKEQIEAKVQETFKSFPNAKKVYATVDGNVFLHENRAHLHAGVNGTVLPFERPFEAVNDQDSANDPSQEKKLNAKEAVAAIQACASLEDLEKYRSDDRTTVKAAFEKRLAELESSEDEDEEIEVTQQYLDDNPELVEKGVSVGDKVKIAKS